MTRDELLELIAAAEKAHCGVKGCDYCGKMKLPCVTVSELARLALAAMDAKAAIAAAIALLREGMGHSALAALEQVRDGELAAVIGAKP